MQQCTMIFFQIFNQKINIDTMGYKIKKTDCSSVFLAVWKGLEPSTPGVTGRYSNQLNYHTS